MVNAKQNIVKEADAELKLKRSDARESIENTTGVGQTQDTNEQAEIVTDQ